MDRTETQSSGLMALATFAASLEPASMPPRIAEKAKACLLYGLAVGIAAREAEQPKVAARAQIARPLGPEAIRLLDGARTTAEDAAFANATLFHARCQEDAHPAGHVGAVVLPAALAVAQSLGATGAELIAAIVAGYEVALRIGRDHVTDLSARGFRSTSAYGVFGAAAAAARLRGLDPEGTAHALALAANMAGGLRAFVEAGSDDFPYHAGFAARNGLLAAALVAAGAEGPLDVLESEAGFFASFGGERRDYGARLSRALGHEFEMERVTFKPYPVCQFHRAVVRALISLRPQASGVEATAIEIRMNPTEANFWGVRFAGPFRRFSQAFMSAPYCAAVAWKRGNVQFSDLNVFGDPAVEMLIARITVAADAKRLSYDPLIRVTLRDGRRLISEGNSEDYLLQWASAVAMMRALGAEVGVPTAAGDELIRTVAALDRLDDLSPLLAATRSCLRFGGERVNAT
ncbi:MAG: MmgE/PrpD family protein [Bradyrhizobium sp.]